MKVTVTVSDGERNVVAEIDGVFMKPVGLMLVWTWGLKDGKQEEEPVAFTKIPSPALKKISEGRYLLEGAPVFWENLSEIGL